MFRIREINGKKLAEEIKPGDIVQHFKRTDDMQANEYLYRIIAEAKHTETNEYMVVYPAMYGDFQLCPPKGYVPQFSGQEKIPGRKTGIPLREMPVF